MVIGPGETAQTSGAIPGLVETGRRAGSTPSQGCVSASRCVFPLTAAGVAPDDSRELMPQRRPRGAVRPMLGTVTGSNARHSLNRRRPHLRVAPHRRHRQVRITHGDGAGARRVRRRHGDRGRAAREHLRSQPRSRCSTTSTPVEFSSCRTPPAATRPTRRSARRGWHARLACRTG